MISRRFWFVTAAVAVSALMLWGILWLIQPGSPPWNTSQLSPPEVAHPANSISSHPAAIEESGQPVTIDKASALSTADIALQLAAWPEGKRLEELPAFARLLASRGPGAVNDISSALATADSNSARGVLSDALALIGTGDAVQELCNAAIKVPEGPARASIATAFRTLGNPAAVPMLASVFNQTDDPQITAEAGGAIRRLADAPGVFALTELMAENDQLHSQREALLEVLAGIQSPAARPALEALAADESDPERAAAARKALSRKP